MDIYNLEPVINFVCSENNSENDYTAFNNFLHEIELTDLAQELNSRTHLLKVKIKSERARKRKFKAINLVLWAAVLIGMLFCLNAFLFDGKIIIPGLLTLMVIYKIAQIQSKFKNQFNEDKELRDLKFWYESEIKQLVAEDV